MIKILEKLGFSEKEAKVYIAGLELGFSSVQKIAQKAGLNRITTYVAIESLKKNGLASFFIKGKKRFFTMEGPERLLNILEEKKSVLNHLKKEFLEILPELKSIYNLAEKKPKVKFYEGFEGLKNIYEDTLKEQKEILAFVAVSETEPKLKKWLNSVYIRKRKELNIRAKVIAPDTSETKEYQSRDKKELRETILIPRKKFPFSIEINIYDHKLALISYKIEEMIGVIIESRAIAETMRLIFDLVWSKTK